MRRFLIFFGAGLLVIIGVFSYAQYKRDDIVVVSLNDLYKEPKGQVLSSKSKKAVDNPANQIPVKISIYKSPIYLWYRQTVTIQTVPKAEVRVKVIYANGSINNNGTQTGIANSSGKYIIKWNIRGKKNIIGIAKIEADVVKGSKLGHTTNQFEITCYGCKRATPTTDKSKPIQNQSAQPKSNTAPKVDLKTVPSPQPLP